MSEEVKGVFVRLPLSDEQIRKLYNPKKSGNENLLAIGTPVTGCDIPVAAYTSQYDIDRVRKGKSGDIYGSKNWEGSDDEVFNIPLIRQSDHLAALAQRDAEIARLQEALRWITYTAHNLPEFMRVEIMLEEAEKALKGPEA